MASGVELGTAWINVAPSFRGFRQAVSKELGGVQVAPHASGWARTIDSKISGAFRTVGKTAAVTFAAAGGALSAGLNAGIKRADILHSFPKQMKNLGYSATEARAAIEKMSDKLLGLPTSVDALAGVTMKFAPLTGSLAEATDLSLALNNAILAGGKSMDVQTNALEQYSQMLAVGKVDMQAWRSMVTAMPGQMDQLSQSILGVGHNSMDLYEAMKSGEVTFDDFNKALLDLNENGLAGYASFSQQAIDATAGISTALQNVKTALARGKAKIIDAIGYEDIVKVINGFSREIGKAHDKVADFITVAKDADKTGRSLQDRLGEMAAGFGLLAGAITVGSKWEFISGLSSQVDQVAKSFNVFDRLPARVGASFSAVKNHVSSLKNTLPSIGGALSSLQVPKGLGTSALTGFGSGINKALGSINLSSGVSAAKSRISQAIGGLAQHTGGLSSKLADAWVPVKSAVMRGGATLSIGFEAATTSLSSKVDSVVSSLRGPLGRVSGAGCSSSVLCSGSFGSCRAVRNGESGRSIAGRYQRPVFVDGFVFQPRPLPEAFRFRRYFRWFDCWYRRVRLAGGWGTHHGYCGYYWEDSRHARTGHHGYDYDDPAVLQCRCGAGAGGRSGNSGSASRPRAGGRTDDHHARVRFGGCCPAAAEHGCPGDRHAGERYWRGTARYGGRWRGTVGLARGWLGVEYWAAGGRCW